MGTSRALAVSLLLVLTATPLAGAVLPVQLTLAGPQYAPVDEPVTFTGVYRVGAVPLPGTRVTLYVDDEAVASTIPIAGSYQIPFVFGSRGAYSVRAVAEEGTPAEARSPTITVRAAVPPSPAQDVVASPTSGSVGVRVTWAAPADDGGAPIKEYRILRQDGQGAWVARQTAPPNVRALTESGLFIGRSYSYRVIAANAVGSALPADAPVVGDPPASPIVTATPVHLSDLVRVAVSGGGGPTQQIDLERSVNGGAWHRIRLVTADTLVHQDSIYVSWAVRYRATAKSLVGDSAPSGAIEPAGDLPGAPTSVTATVPGAVRVEWSLPSSGGAVQGFEVYEDGVRRATESWSARSVDLTTTAGTHAYTVRAVSILGLGPASAAASVTLNVPSSPMGLAVVVTDGDFSGTANLSWNAPADDGGAPVTSYRVYRTLLPGGTPSLLGTRGAGVTSWSDPNMGNGKAFRYEVRAVNAAGAGPGVTIDASVEDYRWVLQHAISHFRACETIGGTTVCTNVASGGTYDRQGTGAVTYSAVYDGLVTRQDVPMAGRDVSFYMYQVGEDELTETPTYTTGADGRYVATWPGLTRTFGGCETLEVRTSASYAGMYATTSDFLTVCP